MKAVYKNFTLGAIEENLSNLIKDCSMWSDLNVSFEEYDILNQKIQEAMRIKPDIGQMQKRYPLVHMTHAVYVILYEEYQEEEDFWKVYGDKLGADLSQNEKTVLAKNWELILEQLGLVKKSPEISCAEELPLLSQIGIPNSELEDLFDAVKYRDTQEEFQPQVLMEQWMECRSYAVGAATRAYIKWHPEKAAQFLCRVNELIHTDQAKASSLKLDERIWHKFSQWLEKEKYRGRKPPRSSENPSPYLIYDSNQNQFHMVLPPYSVKNEYADSVNCMIIDNDYNRYHGRSRIFSDGSRRYTKEQRVPVKAARSYILHWYEDTDESNSVLEKRITGPFGYGAAIFDLKGRPVQEVFSPEMFPSEPSASAPLLLKNIRYKESFGKQNSPILYWDIQACCSNNIPLLVRRLDEDMSSLRIDPARYGKLKAASGEKHFIYLEHKLKSGIYSIQPQAEVPMPKEEAYGLLHFENTNLLKYKGEDYKDRIGSLNDILITTGMNYDSVKMLQKIKTIVEKTGEKRDPYLDERGCAVLLLLICSFCGTYNEREAELRLGEEHKKCVKYIREILYYISTHMLDARQRAMILQNLWKKNVSEEQLHICFDVLKLQTAIFEKKEKECSPLMERLSETQDITAMRALIKNKTDESLGMRLLRLIGLPAMREMLHFKENPTTKSEWIACYEALFHGDKVKADYRFLPTPKITGNHEEFNTMVDWSMSGTYHSPEIHFEEKQSEGIAFCGRRYLDVLLSWYMKYMKKRRNLAEDVKELIMQITDVDGAYQSLKPEIRNSIVFYERALRDRCTEEKSVFASFYYCGLASVILASGAYLELDGDTFCICDAFLQKMSQIFPELVERDLLLADVYTMFNMGLTSR
ncbi:hypothetical protein [Aminipila luticellarii]|uniref:Uncharacterized protein n=1 Tax=Aminipila luticellarii TaxID=2507160 RepID=A0A410PUW6_9FIRM|nr:hypothetical protein [Aminipila luticellarii]QAT42688.1 hypothetical protein EQM06_05285 [Aminipila luticellarii]